MNSIKEQLAKLNRTCVMIACVHWVISFFTDKLIFSYVSFDFSSLVLAIKSLIMLGAKALFLPILILFWQLIFWLIKKADRRFVRFFVVYGGLQLLLLLLVWPGIWRMDEFGLLFNASKLQPVFWQNYLTSIFYIYAIMLIPTPAGVIICQIFVNTLIVAYIVSHAEQLIFQKKSAWGYLLLLPFLLFPVLDSNLYPMRMNVYAFLELFVLFLLFECYVTKNGKPGKLYQALAVGTLLASWRSEGIYYIIVLPTLIVIILWGKVRKQQLVKMLLSFWAGALFLVMSQMLGNHFTSGNSYDLTSVVLPAVPLIERAYEDEAKEAKALLEDMDLAINVEIAYQGAKEGKTGIAMFWSDEDFTRDVSQEDYKRFKHAFYQLVMRYPDSFLKERMQCFVESNTLLNNTTNLFTENGNPNYEEFQKYPLSRPINNNIRTSVIKILEWRSFADYEQCAAGYGMVYGIIAPLLFSCFATVTLLVRRRYVPACLILAALCKVPLIFLTAPSRLFMYYYPIFLIGWTIAIYAVVSFVAMRERRKNE